MPLLKFVASLIERLRGKRAAPHQPTAAVVASAVDRARERERERVAAKSRRKNAPRELVLSGRAPDDLKVEKLDLSAVDQKFTLPPALECFELTLAKSSVDTLLSGVKIAHRLDLTGCKQLTNLPAGLKTGTLSLKDCTGLTALPEDLNVHFLDLDGCRALETWPESAVVSLGRVTARNCVSLRRLPASLGPISSLDLSGCTQVDSLPEGLRVTSWVDLHGTGVSRLPESMKGVRLRWKGVMVPEKVIFAPETMTAAEILAEPNAEVRRVMLDRFGLERLLAETKGTVRDEDKDAGGTRQLVAVDLPGDEPLVCVVVLCPSTSRRYMIRVPPATKTCREAVAWTAGFDRAEDYAPLQET